jgi:hypothetical protein
VKEKETERLYQPLASGERAGVAAVTAGATLSILTLIVADEERLTPFVAEQVRFVLVVSVRVSQPTVSLIPDSGSLADQRTITLLVCQPLLPSVPASSAAMTGGVGSRAADEGGITTSPRRRARTTRTGAA